jgi:hypothetical protein
MRFLGNILTGEAFCEFFQPLMFEFSVVPI